VKLRCGCVVSDNGLGLLAGCDVIASTLARARELSHTGFNMNEAERRELEDCMKRLAKHRAAMKAATTRRRWE